MNANRQNRTRVVLIRFETNQSAAINTDCLWSDSAKDVCACVVIPAFIGKAALGSDDTKPLRNSSFEWHAI